MRTLAIGLFLVARLSAPLAAGEDPPNLVLAIADDLDPDHPGFAGNALARTPSLDRLAHEGVLFPTLYAQGVCRPALATLLTGRWPHETGILGNLQDTRLDPAGALPALLRQRGYATYCGGKFWEGALAPFGFDAPAQNDERFARNGEEGQADLFRFLDERAAKGPWFVWWAPSLPHTPHRPPLRFARAFEEVEVPVPEGFAGDPAEYAAAERAMLGMDAWLDAEFRRFLAKLDELGERRNTVILFVADNGWSTHLPAKGTPREKGVRSPLVVSVPGESGPGRRIEALVDLVDVHATVLDYAGVPLPAHARGRSLRPLLEGRAFEARERLFGAAYPRMTRGKPEELVYALYARDARFKYVRYLRDVNPPDLSPGARLAPPFRARAGGEELFDLERDPLEQHDLAALEEQAGRLEAFRAASLAWWRASGGGELPVH